ncbi:MAG: HPr(Ser) kinase/phosphatase [Polyangiales bacterium]
MTERPPTAAATSSAPGAGAGMGHPASDPRADGGDSEGGGITVGEMIADPGFGCPTTVLAGRQGLDRRVRSARIQKSGLALVGHFHGLESWRIQILGATELSFLEALSPDARRRSCDGFAALVPCAVVVTRGVTPPRELVDACDRSGTPLLMTEPKSSTTINAIHTLLDDRLAPRTRIHGVLVRIFGVGTLLLGRSGIGKSECALDLVMRGHRFVADDVVICQYKPPGGVLGSAAPLLEHHIEIRGLGILNVRDLFGVTSVVEKQTIDLVVKLSDVTEAQGALEYDRLGVDDRFHRILGVEIPEVTVPVRPGRDMATILEIAARNDLLKRAGHHGAREFRDRLEKTLLGRAQDAASKPIPPDAAAALPPAGAPR